MGLNRISMVHSFKDYDDAVRAGNLALTVDITLADPETSYLQLGDVVVLESGNVYVYAGSLAGVTAGLVPEALFSSLPMEYREAKTKALRARDDFKRELRFKKLADLKEAAARGIVAALGTRGSLRERNPEERLSVQHVLVDGEHPYGLDIREENNRFYNWRPSTGEKLRVRVERPGPQGARVSFPQRKDGTHNYAAIAAILIEGADHLKRSREIRARIASNAYAAARVMSQLHFMSQYEVSASSDPVKPVAIRFSFNRAMTEGDALKLDGFLANLLGDK